MIRVVVDMIEVGGVVSVQRTSLPSSDVTVGELAALHLLCVQFEEVDVKLLQEGLRVLRHDGTPRVPLKKTTRRRKMLTTK